MKKVLKILIATIVVFWGTIVILQAQASAKNFIAQHKKEPDIIETTDFISKKGGGFVNYIMSEINMICIEIEGIKAEIENPRSIDNIIQDIEKLQKKNLGLKEIVEKKPFIGLDSFIIKVTDFTTLVDSYIKFLNDELSKNDDFDINMIEQKQKAIQNIKAGIEELIKTIEVN